MKYEFDKYIDRTQTKSEKWDFGERDVFPMWVADMDFASPPAVVEAILKRAAHGIYGYTFAPPSYYRALMDWVERRHGWPLQQEWICYSPGVVPGINMLIRALTQPGDEVILQMPVYYPFFEAVKGNGCRIVNNALKLDNGRYFMDFADLAEKCAKKRASLLVLCNPHNPVGRVWEREELEKVGEICLANGVTVISDEIHSDLIYPGYKHLPFAGLSPEMAAHSVTCYAPSKTFNLAGLQTSCLVIPDAGLRRRYLNVLAANGLEEPNIFGIEALEAAYRYGADWLEELLGYLKGNLDYLRGCLRQNIPEVKLIEPQGTYLVWLDCRELGLSPAAQEEMFLGRAKLWLDEGYIFGNGGEGFARINIACPRVLLEEGLHRLEKAVKGIRK